MSRWAWGAFALSSLLAAAAPLRGEPAGSEVPRMHFPGWPSAFEGRPLRALPLTEREVRFAADFPGRIGRFTDGERELVLRWVEVPTRQLHPAEDCFRGLGYQVTPATSWRAADGTAWHRFTASRGDTRLAIREVLTDGAGARWTDTSAWYWSAALGRTRGPWWAVTVAEHEQGSSVQSGR